jgi:hypothetical protein
MMMGEKRNTGITLKNKFGPRAIFYYIWFNNQHSCEIQKGQFYFR